MTQFLQLADVNHDIKGAFVFVNTCETFPGQISTEH